MKAFQIEDAKTRFFKTKEDYLNFKQAWKDFHNDGRVVETREYKDHLGTHEYKVNMLDSTHYMIYNLLRGYESHRGYSPLVNPGRLSAHNGSEWCSYDETLTNLIQTARRVTDINSDSEWSRRFAREAIDKMRLPFGGTVSNAMLYELASEVYEHLSGQPLPTIEAEEQKSFVKAGTVRKTVNKLMKV
jgi:hypothetical protein